MDNDTMAAPTMVAIVEEDDIEDEEKTLLTDEAPLPLPESAAPTGPSRMFWISAGINTISTAAIVRY